MDYTQLVSAHLALLESHDRLLADLAASIHQTSSDDQTQASQINAMRQRARVALQDAHLVHKLVTSETNAANNHHAPTASENHQSNHTAPFASPTRKRSSEDDALPPSSSAKRRRGMAIVEPLAPETTVPIVEFEDVSAETEARVRSAERRRKLRVDGGPTAVKRKRESGDSSVVSVEGRVERLNFGRPAKKRVRKVEDVRAEEGRAGLWGGVGKGNPKRQREIGSGIGAAKRRASGEEADDERELGRDMERGVTGKKRR